MLNLGKNFWLYAIGRFISQLGWAVQDVALPLYVLDVTKSGAMMSIFLIAELVPRLALSPIAGVVGDRYNRKALMVWLDIARGVLLFGVIAFELLNLKTLLIVQVLMSIMGAFFASATGAMFADLVEKDELTRATSTVQTLGIIARIAGPLLGGIIYAFGGIRLALLINAVSFFGSGLFEMFIHYEWKTKELKGISEIKGDLLEGLRFIKTKRALMILMSYALLINFLFNPIGAVVLPYVFRIQIGFSAQQFGALQTAIMVGMLLGNALIMAKLGNKAEMLLFKALFMELTLFLVITLLCSPFISLEVWTLFVVFIAIDVLLGILNALVNVPISAKLQKMVPSELRGRVFSVFEMLAMGTTPIGMAIVGVLLESLRPYQLMIISWLAGFGVTLYYFIRYESVILAPEAEKEGI
ncbi:MFS transporter [Thermococcus paralvinellae]|uniref:Major facilitator superfamily permease n=1 Tax=Thermococcus paralvinellae TaxID=582419 RepID=W0I710_9EURY|nr:MFS transporter [Thermococcus paralvinellae]AHF80198.1 major facilitator superfamily permease [Thermococcus paralvinellae]